jgi:hypothetical protein
MNSKAILAAFSPVFSLLSPETFSQDTLSRRTKYMIAGMDFKNVPGD